MWTVHPRVGGEHTVTDSAPFTRLGSSPRGRGTLGYGRRARPGLRFIPAWAGNTPRPTRRSWASPVHPRVGGEHDSALMISLIGVGSSPRGRGTHADGTSGQRLVRFIPAWAGNTSTSHCRKSRPPVHPRVGGEHCRASSVRMPTAGSSPRGRGTPGIRSTLPDCRRFIPAWAGNTTSSTPYNPAMPVHPRVGGEHEHIDEAPRGCYGSSPRGRGTHGNPEFRA